MIPTLNPAPKLLTDMLRAHVDARPHAIAAVEDGHLVTFQELWDASGRVACSLRQSGVAAGDHVAVHMTPSVRMLVVVWGILRVGAAYLPLAVDYPADRLEYMLTDSRACHVAVDAESLSLIEHLVPARVHLHLDSDLMDTHVMDRNRADGDLLHGAAHCATQFCDVPAAAGRPEHLAYVMYTSGSTGRPKGVMIPHSAIAAQMAWLGDTVGLLPEARILLKTPVSFDAAQWELLANACGATVVVGPAGIHREPERLCEMVRRHRVTMLQCVPTLWRALLDLPVLAECTSLLHLFSGGEALPATVARAILDTLPSADLVNLYGPTETTINATWLRVEPQHVDAGEVISLGVPVRDCSAHILGPDLLPVAPGRVGELWISGAQLAVGYLHRSDLTNERFVDTLIDACPQRLYRTGDLARIDRDGLIYFCGRQDDQVKVNGHRVETDEVRFAIEQHPWIRMAAVVPWTSAHDGVTRLAAFAELDPAEAALMDQDQASQHHRSKADKTAVKAQLSRAAVRSFPPGSHRFALPLPQGRPEQVRAAFARKTYRFYDGAPVVGDTLIAACDSMLTPWPVAGRDGRLDRTRLADVLRWLGPFHSTERLLPKYAYASPGALNATQVYVETANVDGLPNGYYYYHPDDHALVQLDVTGLPASGVTSAGVPVQDVHPDHAPERQRVRFHLVGLPDVVASVYATNITEVLHLEAGHMLGVLDRALAEHGAHLRDHPLVDCPDPGLTEEWIRTATVDIVPGPAPSLDRPTVDLALQVHGKVSGVRRGTYRLDHARLRRLGDAVIERRHVIAINQGPYSRSSFGVTLTAPRSSGWRGFVSMGRALQKLQMNDLGLGLMSSGYASLTGRDQLASVRWDEISAQWGETERKLCYFAIGGPVSPEQIRSAGMKEDSVHMKGPEELLKDELRRSLPYYMVPSHVRLLDKIPTSANGKHDRSALIRCLDLERGQPRRRPAVPPGTPLEHEVCLAWSELLGTKVTSVTDDFFSMGGNSLTAVRLVNQLNRQFGVRLPVQVIFDAPTVRDLVDRIRSGGTGDAVSRIVRLRLGGGRPIVVWPGLGGYPMSLGALAKRISHGRPVLGVQAHGLNIGERPYTTLAEMVDADSRTVLAGLHADAVTLVGYSFGARMAAEVACRLDAAGVGVERLVLIAPGSPLISGCTPAPVQGWSDLYFKKILMSVFTGSLDGVAAEEGLRKVNDRESFATLVTRVLPEFDQALAYRIIDVVQASFGFRSSPVSDLKPVLTRTQVLLAAGDGPSFMDPYRGELDSHGELVSLVADHYAVLKEPAVAVTADRILSRLNQEV